MTNDRPANDDELAAEAMIAAAAQTDGADIELFFNSLRPWWETVYVACGRLRSSDILEHRDLTATAAVRGLLSKLRGETP